MWLRLPGLTKIPTIPQIPDDFPRRLSGILADGEICYGSPKIMVCYHARNKKSLKSTMRHITGFDGLRAFAVTSVMVYHLGWHGAALGWAGVPFFFVLSGFLITGILLDNKDSAPGEFFRTFYVRRALRIFPLYFLALALVCWWIAANHGDFKSLPYFLTYTQNFYLAVTNFAWASGSELGHTWSLAVEEQFYLLWPFAVYFLPRRALVRVIAGMIALAVVSRWWIEVNTDCASFALLTSNLDSLGLGALLAIVARQDKSAMRKASIGMGAIGLAGVLACIVFPEIGIAAPGLGAGNQLVMVSVILASAGMIGITSQTRVPMLEWKPLAYIGKISYGLYVWHSLVYILLDIFARVKWYGFDTLGPLELAGAKVSITFGVSMLSFHLMERPLLRLKDSIRYGGVNREPQRSAPRPAR